MKKVIVLLLLMIGLNADNEGFYASVGIGANKYSSKNQDSDGRDKNTLTSVTGKVGYVWDRFYRLGGILAYDGGSGSHTGDSLPIFSEKVTQEEQKGLSNTRITGEVLGSVNLFGRSYFSKETWLYINLGLGANKEKGGYTPMETDMLKVYIPIEIDGEVRVSRSVGINYLLGYAYMPIAKMDISGEIHRLVSFVDGAEITFKDGHRIKAELGISYYFENTTSFFLKGGAEYWIMGESPTYNALSVITYRYVNFYYPHHESLRVGMQAGFSF
ncbi:hypothetical protein CCZ01_00285 [Helicobacter monodelphidis]|uniref:hypothetical protein n=1 Tax=Helicobacter sp. 15-1451 TaxID=2004995 RepID=UPI000DCC4240|nr:hypothetical protein [Helicobacter sp. 15-1451]RAX59217.1 hypothetical protein CCZ01_00285 [Helicobacter sp. 15-1451]